MDELSLRVEELANKDNSEMQDEIATMRVQMEAMKMEKWEKNEVRKQAQQTPVQIYNNQPVPQQQPIYQQPTSPIIIQQPASVQPIPQVQPQYTAQMDQMTAALNQMNRNLETISSRMNALENKQTVVQPAAAASPIIVNTPAPVIQQSAPTPAPVYITQQAAVNVGLSKVSIYFANGSATVANQYKQLLSEVATESQKDGRIIISLGAFASTTGNPAANQKTF